MKLSVSNTYELVWQIKDAENYKFTKDGICINTHRGKIVKHTLNGSTRGYCINGRFMSERAIRPLLEKIPNIDCPF
jgi:hypothetical protein